MTFKSGVAGLNGWIEQKCPEFANVPREVKASAFYFTILWSVFDLRHLHRSGNRREVVAFCASLSEDLDFEPFQPFWEYFQGRFANVTGVSPHFQHLVGDDHQTADLLRQTLVSQQGTPRDKLAALVFITFRLRCNLVHGDKYRTGLNDQYDNLMQGAKLVTLILDLNAAA